LIFDLQRSVESWCCARSWK